jgi:signal transduction histidine kinase
VVDLLQREFGYYHVHIYLIDQDTHRLIAHQGSGPIGEALKEKGYQLSPEEGIGGYAAAVGETFLSNNVDEAPFYKPNPLLPETGAELAAPLKAQEQILGVLDVHHRRPHIFTEDDSRFLSAVAEQLAVVLDKAMLYYQLQTALKKEKATRAQLVQTEKLAAMGRLIASVAHELNNPLQAIQNALYLVKLEGNLPPQTMEDLQVAIDESTRMGGLIARLRETYRPATVADFERTSINDIIDEVEKLLTTHLRHNDVRLEHDLAADLPPTRVIRDHIKQVILNLCINAIESMPTGGTLTVQTVYHPKDNQIAIRVSDTGTGIPPDVQANIFEPFFTTKEGGTGLGLAVSYEIAQNHGGDIRAENNPGGGAAFTLILPVLK